LQDELQVKYTGGTVFARLPRTKISDPETAKALVKKIVNGYHLPYFTLTRPFHLPQARLFYPRTQILPKCDEEIGYHERNGNVADYCKERGRNFDRGSPAVNAAGKDKEILINCHSLVDS